MSLRKNPLTDLTTYIQTAVKAIKEITSEEAKEAMISGILEEMSGKEADLACDQRGSKQLQSLLAIVKHDTMIDILCKIINTDKDCIMNQYCSHVVEAGIQSLPKSGSTESPLIGAMLTLLKNDTDSLIKHVCATHCIRSFILALGGFISLDKSKQQLELPAQPDGPVMFDDLETVTLQLTPMIAEAPLSLCCHPQAAPTIQTLLLVLTRHRTDVCANLLNEVADKALAENLTADTVGSHTLECLLKCAAACSKKSFRKFVEGVMSSKSRFAGFALQTAISSASDEKSFSSIFKNLEISSPLTPANLAILQRLAAASGTFPECKPKIFEKISSFFGLPLIPKLLTLNNQETWKSLTSARSSPAGCLLLSTLLKNFPENFASEAETAANAIDWFFKSKNSLRVVEELISADAPAAARAAFAAAILPKVPDLCIDLERGGSFLVAALWNGAVGDIALREEISEKLAAVEGLKDVNYKLWRICGLNKSQPQQWHATQEKIGKAKNLMDEIFEKSKKRKTSF